MKRSILIYLLLIGIFACFIWFVIDSGKNLTPQSEQIIETGVPEEKANHSFISSNDSVWEQFFHSSRSSLDLLLLQIIIILFVSKVFGALITKIGQPAVVGEIVAGIFLGPSIMGLAFPAFSDFLSQKIH